MFFNNIQYITPSQLQIPSCEPQRQTDTLLIGKNVVPQKELLYQTGLIKDNSLPSIQIGSGLKNGQNEGDGVGVIVRNVTAGIQPIGEVITNVVTTSNADYAECFEWVDGNTTNEDRIGYFVQLIGDKIQYAKSTNDVIGITSGTSCIVGDSSPNKWHKINKTDNLGRALLRPYYVDKVEAVLKKYRISINIEDKDIKEIINDLKKKVPFSILTEIKNLQPIYTTISNDIYINNNKYIPRNIRKEWAPVGLIGKIYVYDDGKCIPGEKCDCINGIAVPGTKWQVLSRNSPNTIRILFK